MALFDLHKVNHDVFCIRIHHAIRNVGLGKFDAKYCMKIFNALRMYSGLQTIKHNGYLDGANLLYC